MSVLVLVVDDEPDVEALPGHVYQHRIQELGTKLGGAVTALQFQDMATQLTGHAQRRLSVLEERLSSLSDEAARGLQFAQSHPVRQMEMTAGSIDLF